MAKQQRRKPPKRAPGRPKIDDDLAELASMLSEQTFGNDTSGWFEIPWRSGWNAAWLARECFIAQRVEMLDPEIARSLDYWIRDQRVSPKIYEAADSYLAMTSTAILLHDLPAARFIAASLRCVQLTIANSSGGGVTFNDVLRLAFDHNAPDEWATLFVDKVREARCRDAIGLHSRLRNDRNDRLRRAFCIAWDRGLYQAAYALPRAT